VKITLRSRESYDEEMRVGLGLRAHSGWAAMVAVAGAMDGPVVLDRRRIVIFDPKMAGSKQPYHAAAELPFAEGESLVKRAIASSRDMAVEALSAAVAALRSQGHEVAACGVLVGSGKALPSLERIFASHPLIHTAEGEMFRDVLIAAARECGLTVTTVREKEVEAASVARVASLGKQIGPPWTQDQKYAVIAGLSALR
jgi:hypothetical protein